MRKSHLFILLLGTLGIIAWYVWSGRNSTLSKSATNFSLNQDARTDKIVIKTDSSELCFIKREKWELGNIPPDQKRVQELLVLASQVHAVSPVSHSMRKTIIDKLDKGTQIEFYEGKKKLLSYKICLHNKQIYAIKKRSGDPFRISVKGYQNIDLTRIFDPVSSNWQAKLLLNLSPDEISEIHLTYYMKSENGFRMKVQRDSIIQLFNHKDAELIQLADQEKMREYLYFFSNIAYSKKVEVHELFAEELKVFQVEINRFQSSAIRLTAYLKINPETEQPDPNIFYGLTDITGVITLKYSDFDPILVPVDYFLKK